MKSSPGRNEKECGRNSTTLSVYGKRQGWRFKKTKKKPGKERTKSEDKELLKHERKFFGDGALIEAWDEHTLWNPEKDFNPDSIENQLFFPWFFYNWLPDPDEGATVSIAPQGLTIAESYL